MVQLKFPVVKNVSKYSGCAKVSSLLRDYCEADQKLDSIIIIFHKGTYKVRYGFLFNF